MDQGCSTHSGTSPRIRDSAAKIKRALNPIRTVRATRYVTPLREGGSLPAIVEADDDGMYVLKFRGAGQGPKALVAELLSGEIARAAGLPVPEIVFIELDSDLGRTEPDQEIQDLLRASGGLNLGLDYLPGSVTFDPLVDRPDERLASEIVWFDAFVTNVDRTARNTNMLMWHSRLWLIDHGASLYFHHSWDDYLERARSGFSPIHEHVLLPFAREVEDVDASITARLGEDVFRTAVDAVPDEWLAHEPSIGGSGALREAYVEYLTRRLEPPHPFLEEIIRVRSSDI